MYQNTAKGLAALGRNGDSMLMHVNPTEVAALSALLGPTTTNPKTGLPEAYGWGNAIGSVLGGIGSFGIGSSLAPLVSDIAGQGIVSDVLSKAVPALAGAGFNAAIGGITGGKAGAMGGAAQGLLSGGLGAYASEDLLGQSGNSIADMQQQELSKAASKQGSELYKTSQPPHMWQPDILKGSESAANTDVHGYITQDKPDLGAPYAPTSTEQPGFMDNLKTLGSKAFTSEGFKQYEDYIPYLFQAGMIGNAVTSEQESKNSAQQAEENMAQYKALQDLQATNLARQTYGYAGGGPVVMQTQGVLPVMVKIPEPMVERVKDSGGLGAYMQGGTGFAAGGYINLNPEPPQGYYPMSQIASAQPYPAATPQRQEVIEGYGHGGLIDGEGDGMSDDIDADIEGEEPVRVADGEYVVPRHIVDMLGTERLDTLLRQVRKAAYGTEDQINENAGLKAAQDGLGL